MCTEPKFDECRRSPSVHGVVLAGGQSSRMGTDKAILSLSGRPLIERAIDILNRVELPASISGSRVDLSRWAPVLSDIEPPHGPLTGICSALGNLTAQWMVLLTVDMPLVPSSLIKSMLTVAINGDAAAVLPSFADRLHPFPCVLHRDLLSGLASEHAAGRYGCLNGFSLAAKKIGKPLKAVLLESLVESGVAPHYHCLPIEAWLLNVNRPEDLVQAEKWLAISPFDFALSKSTLLETGASQCIP